MPRNGSGQYALPSGNPVVSNTIISASGWANPTLSDIASALTDSIAADGQTVPTANLPMGNFRHTQVANAMARTDYASAGQVQDNALNVLTGIAGTGDAITANLIPGIAAYATGAIFEYPITAANTTTTPTLSIDGLPAKTIVFADGGPLTAGALLAGGVAQLYFDGTNFRTLSMNTPSKDLARIGSQGGTIAGPLTLSSTLGVTGKITGSADITGASLTTAGAVIAATASVSGALTAGSATVTGATTLQGTVNSTQNIGVGAAVFQTDGNITGSTAIPGGNLVNALAGKQPSGVYVVNGISQDTSGTIMQSGQPPAIASINPSTNKVALFISNEGNNFASAVMGIIRDNQFGCYFGLDTNNQLCVGGYSYGAVSYRICHQGNAPLATGVTTEFGILSPSNNGPVDVPSGYAVTGLQIAYSAGTLSQLHVRGRQLTT